MKKLMLIALMALNSFGAISSGKRYLLNKNMGPIGSQTQLGTLIDEGGERSLSKDGISPHKVAQATYDYSVYGGSVGDIALTGVSIPDKAIITRSYIHIYQPLTPANATVAVRVQSAGDILATTNTSSMQGTFLDGVSTGASTVFKRISGGPLGVKVLIGQNNLTAGKFKVFLEYVMSE
jgi:hypothetical protein